MYKGGIKVIQGFKVAVFSIKIIQKSALDVFADIKVKKNIKKLIKQHDLIM